MTAFNFAVVGLRLFGVYLGIKSFEVFETIAFIGSFFGQFGKAAPFSSGNLVLSASIAGGIYLVLGILLFLYSGRLGRRFMPATSDHPNGVTCSFADIQAIAFVSVGLLILASALPNLVRAGFSLDEWWSNFRQDGGGSPGEILTENLGYAIGVFVQVVLGFALMLYPRGCGNIWTWLRTAGTGPKA